MNRYKLNKPKVPIHWCTVCGRPANALKLCDGHSNVEAIGQILNNLPMHQAFANAFIKASQEYLSNNSMSR